MGRFKISLQSKFKIFTIIFILGAMNNTFHIKKTLLFIYYVDVQLKLFTILLMCIYIYIYIDNLIDQLLMLVYKY